MILRIADETRARRVAGGPTMRLLAKQRIPAVMHEDVRERFREVTKRTEILVKSATLTREHRMQRVMKIVAPLRVHSTTARVEALHHARVVVVAFGDQRIRPP